MVSYHHHPLHYNHHLSQANLKQTHIHMLPLFLICHFPNQCHHQIYLDNSLAQHHPLLLQNGNPCHHIIQQVLNQITT